MAVRIQTKISELLSCGQTGGDGSMSTLNRRKMLTTITSRQSTGSSVEKKKKIHYRLMTSKLFIFGFFARVAILTPGRILRLSFDALPK